jgi:hypothetical protein
MAFDDEVLAILAAEREAGSSRLRGWLRKQAMWLWEQADEVEDAALQERYLGLFAAIQSWLHPSARIAPPSSNARAAVPPQTKEVPEPGDGIEIGENAGVLIASAPLVPGEIPEAGERRDDEPGQPADSGFDSTPGDPPAPPNAEQVAADALQDLWHEMLEREATAGYAAAIERDSPSPLEPGPESEAITRARQVWVRIHLVCLRLPAAMAAGLRAEALWAATSDTLLGTADATATSPGEYLIPPLPVAGYAGVDIGDEQGGEPEGEGGSAEVGRMLRIARQMLWLAQHDPSVMVGFGIANSGASLVPFNKDLLSIYRNLVDDKLKTPPECVAHSLVRLDELIRGVVPVPLPAADSWWRSRVGDSEQAMASLVGDEVTMPPIGSPYTSLRDGGRVGGKLRDIVISPAAAPGTASGNVAWVLLAQEGDSKGRVVYVSGP